MINEVIIGNGESRKIKFGTFSTTPTNISDLITQLQSGTIGVDVVYPSATESAGISQVGTKLNQETLLNTAAESAIWGSAEPTLERTPSDAFKKLGEGVTDLQSSISSLSSAKLDKTGDTMSGNLTLAENSNNLVSKHLYIGESGASIHQRGSGQLEIKGSTGVIFTSPVDCNNNIISNVATPSNDNEAANKGYVDGKLDINYIELFRIQGQLTCNKTYSEVLSILNSNAKNIIYFNTPTTKTTCGIYYTSNDTPNRIIFYYYSFPAPDYAATMVRISYAPDNTLTILT